MKTSIQIAAGALVAGALTLTACGNNETSEPSFVVAETFANVPICTRFRTGIVYYVADTDEFFFCDGRTLQPLDLSGQDGTSCTVSRDESAGTTTITCEDGTVAVVQDGQDGQDGEDGTSCTIAENAAGATITCGSESVTLTDGQDGSSCSASTDSSGAVTISCDDGTSATIPASGDNGAAASVELLCEVIGENDLREPRGLDCPAFCPCYTGPDLLASDAVACRRVRAPDESRFDSLPLTRESDSGDFEAGEFWVERRTTASLFCRAGEEIRRQLSQGEQFGCELLIEEALGPCVLNCGFGLSVEFECDDDNDCTVPECGADGLCSNPDKPNGESCLLVAGGPDRPSNRGQCLAGVCRPTIISFP